MAVYPINPGPPAHPDYSGKFIPTLWAKKMLERFYDASVIPMISETSYLGDIKNQGDKVIINKVPDITIANYRMGDTLNVQRPAADTMELTIDQGKYWNIILDDVADAQAFTNMMVPWTENASERMKIVVDTEVLAYMVGKASVDNRGATAGIRSNNINLGVTGAPVTITKANVLDYIVDLASTLDEQNIPETGRKIVIPPWMAALLKKSDLRNASISGDQGNSVLRNGRIGQIDRFELYVSNLLPTAVDGATTPTYVFAMIPRAMAFASQLTKTETIRAESTFGTLMRGLMVYGRGIVLDTAIAEGYVLKG